MSNYTPADTKHAQIDLPDNGEDANATNLATGTKDAADNAQVALNALAYYTTQVESTRGVNDGIKRFGQVADATALTAITVGAGVDGEARWVESLKSLFVYVFAAANTVDGVFVINGNGSVGRWLNITQAIRSVGALGLAWVDAAGRLQGPALIPGVVDEFTDFDIDGNDDDIALLHTFTDQATYQDTDAEFDVASCLIGDVIEAEVCLLARLKVNMSGGGAGATCRGVVTLFIGNDTGALTAIHSVILAPSVFAANLSDTGFVPITLIGRFVSTDESPVTIKVQAKTTAITNTDSELTIFSPVNARARRYRP